MPICAKCRYGFESSLGFCPKCGAEYRDSRRSGEAWSGSGWRWILGILLLLGFVSPIVLSSAYPLVLSLCLIVLILYIWSIFWSYGDAEARGKSGCAVALLVALLTWPLGLLIWFIFRP
jgi:hypothetical protein